MNRQVAVVLLVTAALLTVTGSGGFTATSADRDIRVSVSEDEHALLGVEIENPSLDNGNNKDTVLVTITNNFGSKIEYLNVTVTDSPKGKPHFVPRANRNGRTPIGDVPTPIGVGESVEVTGNVVCGGQSRPESWAIEISATTDAGSEVELVREVTVCEKSSNRQGNGTATTAATATDDTPTETPVETSESGTDQ